MTYVIAHRGASHEAPENTVPAFERAIEMGADGIETDVQVTADAQLVIHHNYAVDGTTDATGRIDGYTLAELKEMDFGSHKGAEFAGTRIATLDECLDAVRPLKVVNIELKAPADRSFPYVERVVDAIRAHDMVEQTIISAFDHSLLRQVKQICPELRCGALTFMPIPENNPMVDGLVAAMPADVPLSRLDPAALDLSALAGIFPENLDVVARSPQHLVAEMLGALAALFPDETAAGALALLQRQNDLVAYVQSLDFPLDYVHPDYHAVLADPDVVARLAAIGVGVSPYTPDDPDELRALLGMGCYAIITNRPDTLLSLRN